MVTTPRRLVAARLAVPGIAPQQARACPTTVPAVSLIDGRDTAARRAPGQPDRAMPIAAGMSAVRAARDRPDGMRDERPRDRARSLIPSRDRGPLAASSARTLRVWPLMAPGGLSRPCRQDGGRLLDGLACPGCHPRSAGRRSSGGSTPKATARRQILSRLMLRWPRSQLLT